MWGFLLLLTLAVVAVVLLGNKDGDRRPFPHPDSVLPPRRCRPDRVPPPVRSPCRESFVDAPAPADPSPPLVSQYGSFVDPDNPFAPVPCPPGTFCGSRGLTAPTACPANTYSPRPGAAACLPCPAGQQCSAAANSTVGATNVAPCPAGLYCPGPDAATGQAPAPVSCTPGNYCPTGSTKQTPCPAGTFCTANAAQPTPCKAGDVCPPGTGKVTDCPAGSYCPNMGSPVACDPGYYCPAQAAVQKPCPAGQSCINPATKDGSGSVAAGPCPAGYFCPGPTTDRAGESLPSPNQPCPAGSSCPAVSATVGASAPTPCPPGSYCPGGATPATACAAGQLCTAGGLSAPAPCPAGSMCPGTDRPAALCPAGTQCTAAGAKPCPAGSFCPDYQTTLPCPEGTYCPEGASAAQLCPAGFFNKSKGAVSLEKGCAVCPAGAYCPQGSAAPQACPAGFFCPAANPVLVSGTVVQSAQAPQGGLVRFGDAAVPAGVSVAYAVLGKLSPAAAPVANMQFTVRVLPPGTAMPAPFKGSLPATSADHLTATTFTTDAAGRFRVYLPPGGYTVVNAAKATAVAGGLTVSQQQWAAFPLFALSVLPTPYVQATPAVAQVAGLAACKADPASVACYNQIWQNAGCTTLPGDAGPDQLSWAKGQPAGSLAASPPVGTGLAGDSMYWSHMADTGRNLGCFGLFGNYGHSPADDSAVSIPVPVPSVPGYAFRVLLNPADLVVPAVAGMDAAGNEVFWASKGGSYDVAGSADAVAVCKSLNGSAVATYDQVSAAMNGMKGGASWCATGWTRGTAPGSTASSDITKAYYPMSQEDGAFKEGGCGAGWTTIREYTPGTAGVNCYGRKPVPDGNKLRNWSSGALGPLPAGSAQSLFTYVHY